MFAVDTNVLVYAADQRAPEHERCHALVERWRRQTLPWYLTWNVLYEFLRVVTHARVFRKPWSAQQGQLFVTALRAAPGLEILAAGERHAGVLEQTIEELPDLRGNLIHDLHTAALLREHGIRRLYTRDTDFHRFPFLEVIDPLAKGKD